MTTRRCRSGPVRASRKRNSPGVVGSTSCARSAAVTRPISVSSWPVRSISRHGVGTSPCTTWTGVPDRVRVKLTCRLGCRRSSRPTAARSRAGSTSPARSTTVCTVYTRRPVVPASASRNSCSCIGVCGHTSTRSGRVAASWSMSAWSRATSGKSAGLWPPAPVRPAWPTRARSARNHHSASSRTSSSVRIFPANDHRAASSGPSGPDLASAFTSTTCGTGMVGSSAPPSAAASGAVAHAPVTAPPTSGRPR